MSREAFNLIMAGLEEALEVARNTPPLTPFKAFFTDHTTMGISAATAAEARTIANEAARKRGTLVSKIKVIKEQPSND
ncbi:hypothetical protein [Pannonibacter tanglangensis]|uniref:Uncharacterized protein n=1 Tax=Pannonibacter tanglangensis TaxID=2750084 RepID=A0ABW9ZJQ8_9HYPH|nr:hypothetical protein [Pannonibacter sp. XCT-34]NBN64177.1 hypothetical protein [Pannonibacter sp. XCT-34]